MGEFRSGQHCRRADPGKEGGVPWDKTAGFLTDGPTRYQETNSKGVKVCYEQEFYIWRVTG